MLATGIAIQEELTARSVDVTRGSHAWCSLGSCDTQALAPFGSSDAAYHLRARQTDDKQLDPRLASSRSRARRPAAPLDLQT